MKKIRQRYNLTGAGSVTGTLLFFLMMYTFPLSGQLIITPGTTLYVAPGSTLHSAQNVVILSGAALNTQGTMVMLKDFTNLNPSDNDVGSGTLFFNGTNTQNISGQNIIQNLTLSNSMGAALSGHTRVNGTLTLTNGRLTLGSYNLLMGPSSSVGGSPSASKMVVPTGSGQMRKEFAAAGSFTFPVGDATGTIEFSPAVVTFTTGTFNPGNYVGVNLVDNQYPGTAISYLTRYWNVAASGITGYNGSVSLSYMASDVVGIETDIFSTKVNTLPFITYNAANTGSKKIFADGLSSFGTFTGNLGSAGPPPIRSLQNKNITSGMTTCADAAQTLLIAGNGTTYQVQGGGSVTHIAGSNIIYYPGTRVFSGGYLHGYISATFCAPYIHPAPPAVSHGGDEQPAGMSGERNIVRIFPNPTTGNFTLELSGKVDPSTVNVEILGLLGKRIESVTGLTAPRSEFSLTGKPTGMYMIHVTTPSGTEVGKIIKH